MELTAIVPTHFPNSGRLNETPESAIPVLEIDLDRKRVIPGDCAGIPYEIGCYGCLALIGWTGATAGRAKFA
jgi:hypothetical protein